MLKVEQSKGRNYIVGNTFPVKDALRAEGLRWDAERKGWWTPDAALAASLVEKLSAEAGASTWASTAPARPSSPSKPPATKQCWECGCRFTYADAKSGGGDWSESYCGC